MLQTEKQIILALQKLLNEVPNRNTGICNNLPLLLSESMGRRVKWVCRDKLKEVFAVLGYDKDYPVEVSILKDKIKAKTEYYEGGNKWSKKSEFGKRRYQLIQEVIDYLERHND